MPDKVNIHQNASDVRKGHRMLPYTGVRIIVETGSSTEEDKEYFKGDETGTVLELNCPWGTQQVADDLYNQVVGYQYQPMTVTGGWLNPATELGDGVTANGVYGGLYKEDTTFGHLYASDFSAPKDEELDHEFTFVSPTDRKIARNRAQTRAEFIIKASEIAAKVEQTGGDNQSFGWSLISTGFGLYSGNKQVFFCDKDGISVDGKITARSGYIGNGNTGFTITNTAIYNGKPKFQDTTSANTAGVYIGTNGIALGRYQSGSGSNATYDDAFRVSSSGALVANNATIRGGGTFKGNLTVDSITFSSGVTLDGSNITNGTVTDGKIDGVSGSKVGSGIAGGNINSGSIAKDRCSKAANNSWDKGEAGKDLADDMINGRKSFSSVSTSTLSCSGSLILNDGGQGTCYWTYAVNSSGNNVRVLSIH